MAIGSVVEVAVEEADDEEDECCLPPVAPVAEELLPMSLDPFELNWGEIEMGDTSAEVSTSAAMAAA